MSRFSLRGEESGRGSVAGSVATRPRDKRITSDCYAAYRTEINSVAPRGGWRGGKKVRSSTHSGGAVGRDRNGVVGSVADGTANEGRPGGSGGDERDERG